MPRKGRKAGKGQQGATGSDAADQVKELVPNAEWVDLEQPARMEAYRKFDPPPQYRCGMAAAHKDWAPEVDRPVARAITYVTANVIAPYILSLQEWKDHASDFFRRLCIHRRYTHAQLKGAIEELRERHRQLHDRIGPLEIQVAEAEARLADVEAGLAAAHTRFKYANATALKEHLGPRPPRERSVPERLLDAQLHAIRARSRSPGHHVGEVMQDYLGTGPPVPSMPAPKVAPVGAPGPSQPVPKVAPGGPLEGAALNSLLCGRSTDG